MDSVAENSTFDRETVDDAVDNCWNIVSGVGIMGNSKLSTNFPLVSYNDWD